MMKKFVLAAIACISTLSCTNDDLSKAIYKDPSRSVEDRVEDLVGRMTLQEKILQLSQWKIDEMGMVADVASAVDTIPAEIGSIITFSPDSRLYDSLQVRAMTKSRLGIPMLFGYDAIHGYRIVFPVPIAQAASFNPELAARAGEVTAQEASAAGVNWVFSPMVDIARDGRWGRVMEGYGEDPVVASRFAEVMVNAYQGQGDDKYSQGHVAACLKHFVGYGASEAGRDYTAVDVSRQLLWDTYIPPFAAGVKAGAAAVMCGYNTLSGIPAAANHYTLTEVLKEKLGHQGFIVSDWGAVEQTVLQGAAADRKEAALMTFNAGIDMNMCDYVFKEELPGLVKEGKIKEKDIDKAVARILKVKFEMGLFEHPYRVGGAESDFLKPSSFELAEELAAECAVLLKNDKILPLKKNSTIAFIGPIADDRTCVLGAWRSHGVADNTVSILSAAKKEFSNILYSKGCDIEGNDRSGFAQAVAVARKADIVVFCMGEGDKWTGENRTRSQLRIPDIQEALLFELKKTGKPIVVLLESGRPIDLTRIEPACDALMDIWCSGHRVGPAVAGLLSGRYNPSGKLPITFPYTVGQVPIYYNHRDRGRRGKHGEYIDGTPLTPKYDFGEGLSYSTFEYSEPTLDALTAKVKITNTSDVDGKEVVLWFIKDHACSIARPVKELKHFEKRMIPAGSTEEFVFEIDKMRDLGYVDAQGNQFFESGKFTLMVGDKSIDFTR